MVSKASEDFPDPDSPVKTTSLSRGMERVTFLRLCSRAPRIVIWSVGIFLISWGPRLFLISCDGKRPAGRGHQPLARAFDPALGDGGPPPSVDDVARRSQRLAHLRGGDEAELQVKAHGPRHARLDRTDRAAHGRVGQGADHPTMDEPG